jgi:hypothetical protein
MSAFAVGLQQQSLLQQLLCPKDPYLGKHEVNEGHPVHDEIANLREVVLNSNRVLNKANSFLICIRNVVHQPSRLPYASIFYYGSGHTCLLNGKWPNIFARLDCLKYILRVLTATFLTF